MRARFIRGQDPKKAMGIGMKSQRVFKDIRAVVEWALEYPGAFAGESVSGLRNDTISSPFEEWEKKHIIKETDTLWDGKPETVYRFDHNYIGKLAFVKWIKDNITFEPYPEARIGLKDSKIIADTVEERLIQKFYPEANIRKR